MSNGYGLVAQESTYGTAPASGYRDFELVEDTHKTLQDTLQHRGLRRNAAAPRLSGRRIIDKGGEGTISVPGYSNGLGILFRTAASTAASAVVDGGEDAFEQVFTFTHVGPPAGRSVTTEFWRDRKDGSSYNAFTYKGGRCHQLEYGVGLDDFLQWKFLMDYISVERPSSNPSRTPVAVEPDTIFSWQDPTITLTPVGGSGAAQCLSEASGTIPTGIDREDWCLKKGTSRHQPTRHGIVEPTGKLAWKYDDPTYYDAFRSGQAFTLSVLFEGDDPIEDTTVPSVEIVHPAIVFAEANDPQVTADNESTMQELPFVVLDDEENPHTTITLVTSDTTY